MEQMSMAEKLQRLRDHYWMLIGPLVLLLGIGLDRAPLLASTAAALLALLTLNKLAASLGGARQSGE